LGTGKIEITVIYCFKLLIKILRGATMLTNNIELDLKTRIIEEGVTQTEIAEDLGVSIPYVNRIIRGREHIVNKTFVNILDKLGYDVELTYKKKEQREY
jgi:plasmid maintenance system antidote protein VapI